MNATERARRSDSLYYDTQVTNRRALCDMIAHLESDLAESKAENAKLRELVDILCFCMQIHKRCDDCKLNGAKGELGHDPLLACDGLHEMLKELGIEVE